MMISDQKLRFNTHSKVHLSLGLRERFFFFAWAYTGYTVGFLANKVSLLYNRNLTDQKPRKSVMKIQLHVSLHRV